MTIVQVAMLAFMNGEIRNVEIPEGDPITPDTAFFWGQNIHQPITDRCSVSVGDVIMINGHYHLVMPTGFDELTPEEFAAYLLIERRERSFYAYDRMQAKNKKPANS